jgi:hypothetical protein
VAEHADSLYTPVDLSKAVYKGIISQQQCRRFLDATREKLRGHGYDGSSLKENDLILAVGENGEVMKDASGEPTVILCNFELIWKIAE